jgi:hypothetical protein
MFGAVCCERCTQGALANTNLVQHPALIFLPLPLAHRRGCTLQTYGSPLLQIQAAGGRVMVVGSLHPYILRMVSRLLCSS